MNTPTGLVQLGQERDQLLARVVQVLEADTRVAAAWLSGSYGRAEVDAWSDLDLHVAVVDAHLPTLLDEHQALFARCGEPLLVYGGYRSNSLPSARFWLVQYAPYMLEVDWSIGPAQAAVRPEASHLLFDRTGIPTTPPLTPVRQEQRQAEAAEQLSFFWAMAPIAIKYAGRGQTAAAVHQVRLLQDAYITLWHVLRRPERLQKEPYQQNRPLEAALAACLPRLAATIDPVEALATIRALCAAVQQLHAELASLGAMVDAQVVQAVNRLADLAEPIASSGGSTPQRTSRR